MNVHLMVYRSVAFTRLATGPDVPNISKKGDMHIRFSCFSVRILSIQEHFALKSVRRA